MERFLNTAQTAEFRRILQERFKVLRADIRAKLLKSDDERYQQIAGEVHDLGDEAVADVLTDIDNAEVNRDVEELKDLDAALMRLYSGVYGECLDCSGEIGIDRLRAYPTAKRCEPCQRGYERTHLRKTGTTL